MNALVIDDRILEAVLRDVHEMGFINGTDMPKHEPVLQELLRQRFIAQRDLALSAALVMLAGADQPERAAEAASNVLDAAEPSPYGHSPLYDLTEAGYVYLEARRPPSPHCGQVRIWTQYCHGAGRCACICTACSADNRKRRRR